MAATGNTVTLQSGAYQGRYMKLTCTSTSNPSTNKTTISWKLESIGGSSSYYATICRVYIAGTEVYNIDKGYSYKQFPVAKGETTGSITVEMDNSGNKLIYVDMDVAIYTSSTTRYSVDGGWQLPTVPRYPTISSFSVNKISGSSTSLSFVWSASAPGGNISKLEYSTDNGASFKTASSVTSPLTVSGLASAQGYTCKIRVTSSASGLTATSSGVYQTTYQQPSATISTANISGYNGISQVKVSWSSNMTISTVKYSKDNGATWSVTQSPNAKSGNYTFTGLGEGSTPNFKVQVTAATGSCVTTSGTSQRTLYTRVKGNLYVNGSKVATNNGQTGVALKNGDTLQIKDISNPGNLNYKLFFENPDNQHQYTSSATSGTTILSMNADQIASRLQYFPNDPSQGFNVGIVTLNDSSQHALYHEFFGTISAVNVNPTFDENRWTYQDTNANTVALTGSNQILVNGFSKLRVSVNTAASGNGYATIKQYAVSGCTSGSSSTTGNIDCPTATNGGTIKVTAKDSRNNVTETTRTATFKNYAIPTMASISATRSNGGVGTVTTLTFNGTWWNANFGASNNTIAASYRYKSGSTWSSSRAITLTTSGNNYSFNDTIYGDLAADGFTLGTTFTIEVTITDELNGGKSWTTTLSSGTPAIAISGSNVAIGKQYDTNTGGKLQVKGEIQAETNVLSPSFESTNVAGMKTDQYFNLTHKRNTNTDNWSICANDGSASFKIYPETGNTSVTGFVNLQRDKAIQFGGVNTLRGNSSNNTILSANGATMYFRPNGDLSDNGAVNIATTGTISVPPTTSTHLNGAKGIGVLINGTAAGNGYTMLARQKSTNGVFNLGVWGGTYELFYIADSIISAGSNSYTKKLDLLTESGNSNFPGLVYAPSVRSKLETMGGRITNANISHAYENDRAHVQLLQATASMTSNKPFQDGYILHFSWDNGGQYNSQLFMPDSHTHPQFRGCGNGTWGSWEDIHPRKTLYYNATGTTGTVSLSESAANFMYLEVFYKEQAGKGGQNEDHNSVKIYSPNGAKFVLQLLEKSGSTDMRFCTSRGAISGTSITRGNGAAFYLNGGRWEVEEINIYRVDGYR